MRTLLLISLVLILSSCATAYKQRGFGGGYSEVQLNNDVFNVSFKGNSNTSMKRAVDFALLRSSELTLVNGYNYFVILDGDRYAKEYVYSDRHYPGIHHKMKPRVFYKIKCFDEKPERFSYDARMIARTITRKYDL